MHSVHSAGTEPTGGHRRLALYAFHTILEAKCLFSKGPKGLRNSPGASCHLLCLALWGSRGVLWWTLGSLDNPLGVHAVRVHCLGELTLPGLTGPPYVGVKVGWVPADDTVLQEHSSHLLKEIYHQSLPFLKQIGSKFIGSHRQIIH